MLQLVVTELGDIRGVARLGDTDATRFAPGAGAFCPVEAVLEHESNGGAVLAWPEPSQKRLLQAGTRMRQPGGDGWLYPFAWPDWWKCVDKLGRAVMERADVVSVSHAAAEFVRNWGPLTVDRAQGRERVTDVAAAAVEFMAAVDLTGAVMAAQKHESNNNRAKADEQWQGVRDLLGPREVIKDHGWVTLPRGARDGLRMRPALLQGPLPMRFTTAGNANSAEGLLASPPGDLQSQAAMALGDALEWRMARLRLDFDRKAFPPTPVLRAGVLIDAAWCQWWFDAASRGFRIVECSQCGHGPTLVLFHSRGGLPYRCPACRQKSNTAVKKAARKQNPERERLRDALHKTLRRRGVQDALYRDAVAALEAFERQSKPAMARLQMQEWLFSHGLRQRRR